MKIVHVIETLDLASGGPAVCAASVAAAEAALGHEVSIVCYDSRGHAAALRQFQHYPGFERVSILTARGGRLETMTAFRAGKVLKEKLDAAEFMVIHGVWRPLLAKAIALAQARGVSYEVTPHGMLDPWCMQQKAWKKLPAWWLLWRRLCNRAVFIRALNADEAAALAPLALTVPVEIVPNGIFPEDYTALPQRGTFHALFPQVRQRRFILFLSRLHTKKGLDFLMEAFAMLAPHQPDVDLVIAGPDDGALAQLENDIQRLALGDRVHVVGPLYGAAKLAALIDADCFCLPSRQEGFSIAITEALACATPVVISENCHFPEVAEVDAGKVVPLDSAAIAAALHELLAQQPDKRAAAGRAGHKLVLERFSWHTIAQHQIRLMEPFRNRQLLLKGIIPRFACWWVKFF